MFPIGVDGLLTQSTFASILEAKRKGVDGPLAVDGGICESEGLAGSPVGDRSGVQGGFFGEFAPCSSEGRFVGVYTAGYRG